MCMVSDNRSCMLNIGSEYEKLSPLVGCICKGAFSYANQLLR
jgi:hypothetical protein